MIKKLIGIGLLFLAVGFCFGQSTAVSAIVTDSDGTVWFGGTWKLTFVPNSANPNPDVYNINGVPLNKAVMYQNGTMDSGGALSFSAYQNTAISPSGSSWSLSICPQASSQCGLYNFSTSTTTLNLSSSLTGVIPSPRFKATSGAYGYNDAEAVVSLSPGNTYFNVTIGCLRVYSGSTFACAAGGSATPAGPSFALNFANIGVTNFQGDSLLIYNPFTKSFATPTLNAFKYATGQQTGGGNNGITNGIATGGFTFADPAYPTTEGAPWGGIDNFNPPLNQGPTASQSLGAFTDYRYGVPEQIYNGSAAVDNRHSHWPSLFMHWTGNSSLTGTFLNPAGALNLVGAWWHGGNNFYNDKTNAATFRFQSYRWAEMQGGGDLQHDLDCFGNGDCALQSGDLFSWGGPNTQGDEGNKGLRQENGEAGSVYTSVVSTISIASDGTTTIISPGSINSSGNCVSGSSTACGTNGEGRILINTSTAYNTGYLSSIGIGAGNVLEYSCSGGCNWDGTFGTSTQTTLTTAVANPVNGLNSFPQTSTVWNVTSSTGFSVGNLACVFDYDYECEKITAVGTGTVTVATDRKPHVVGAFVTTGGLAGYTVEAEADRVYPGNGNGFAFMADFPPQQIIRNAVPIMYSISGNHLFVFNSANGLPGQQSGYSGRAYTTMSGTNGVCTPTVSGGVLTGLTVSGGSGFGANPPNIVFSGTWITKPIASVASWSSSGVSGANILVAGSGISGLSCTVGPYNPYDIYSSAKTVQVWNPTTGAVDGYFLTQPWPVPPTVGQNIEQPHYFYQHTDYDSAHFVGQYQPTVGGAAHSFLDHWLIGSWSGSDRYASVINANSLDVYAGYPIPTNILGRNQLITPDFYELTGAFRRGFVWDTPPMAPSLGYKPSLLYTNCSQIGCAAWTNPFYIFANEGVTQVNSTTNGLIYNPSIDTYSWYAKNLDLTNITKLLLGYPSLTSQAGFVSQIGHNWNPNSNNLIGASWGCNAGASVSLDGTLTDPFGGTQSVWKVVTTGANFGCQDFFSTPVPAGSLVSSNVWLYSTTIQTLCFNATNAGTCVSVPANQWFHATAPGLIANPSFLNSGTIVYNPNSGGTWWEYNPVVETGKQLSASALVNTTASSITSDIQVEQIPNLNVLGILQLIGLSDGCLQTTSHAITSTGSPCGSGGSMVWPAGGAGIPNYSGSNSWNTSYNASNLIPASFISTLNQNTTGTASNLSGTPALPNGTTATTQSAADNSTKLATTAYADRAAGLGVTGGTLVISGGTQGANSCSSNLTVTDTGLTTTGAYSRVVTSYTGDPSALTGWGSSGGMVLQIWASSANTATYHVCNQTTSSITYSSITFGLGAN